MSQLPVPTHDAVVIGGGLNGLAAAGLLARAGLRTLLLERRDEVGGTAIVEEFHPGYRVPSGRHAYGGLHPEVARGLGLRGRVQDEPLGALVLDDAGGVLSLPSNVAAAADAIGARSRKDAAAWVQRSGQVARWREALAALWTLTPPALDALARRDLWPGVKAALKVRGLPAGDLDELLRAGPMCVADLARDWFEDGALQAALCAPAVLGTQSGPWSAGTVATLLHRWLDSSAPGLRPAMVPAGGMGAVARALRDAAEAARCEVRTGAEVTRVVTEGGRVRGLELAGGATVGARLVLSALDPRRTLLGLVGARALPPELVARLLKYRDRGTLAKLHLALDALPRFPALGDRAERLLRDGLLQIGAGVDEIERAFDASKYRRFSERPLLEVSVPTLRDPGLAPAGHHVLSVALSWAPYAPRQPWDEARDALATAAVLRLAEHAPDLEDHIVARELLTPVDLEARFGLSGGHLEHGELALDQLFVMRPVGGLGRYATPIEGLWLCGAGTHPGGASGASALNAAREALESLGVKK